MTKMLNLSLCLLLLSLCATAQKLSNTCGNSPLLDSLTKGQGAALLKNYGYDLHTPWACTKIEASWTSGATILRFQKITAQSDDQTAFSVVKVPTLESIWVIPTATGMVEAAHAESDPHNVAAFNSLLGLHKGSIDAAGWLEVGRLYMTLLGHKEAIPIKDETDSCSGSECTVSFSDRPVVAGEAYNKWSLTFSPPSKDRTGMLIDETRETVHP